MKRLSSFSNGKHFEKKCDSFDDLMLECLKCGRESDSIVSNNLSKIPYQAGKWSPSGLLLFDKNFHRKSISMKNWQTQHDALTSPAVSVFRKWCVCCYNNSYNLVHFFLYGRVNINVSVIVHTWTVRVNLLGKEVIPSIFRYFSANWGSCISLEWGRMSTKNVVFFVNST